MSIVICSLLRTGCLSTQDITAHCLRLDCSLLWPGLLTALDWITHCSGLGCSVLRTGCPALYCPLNHPVQHTGSHSTTLHPAPSYITLHHTTIHFTRLQQCAPHCHKLHNTALHCTTLHHTAPNCTTMHQTAPHCTTFSSALYWTCDSPVGWPQVSPGLSLLKLGREEKGGKEDERSIGE